MEIKKVANGFIEENISVGARTSSGVTVSSDNYEGGSRDIAILQSRAKQMDEPLTGEEKFTLRSEL